MRRNHDNRVRALRTIATLTVGIAIATVTMAGPAVADSPPPFSLSWGSQGTGNGQFWSISGVAAGPNGQVFVVDVFNERVQKFTANGGFLAEWPVGGTPSAIAVDDAGNVFVADFDNHRIRKFDPSGALLTEWGTLGSAAGAFNRPNGVGVDDAGNVYVADRNNRRVQKFTSTGTFTAQWPLGATLKPSDLAVDGAGNVYVTLIEDFGAFDPIMRVSRFSTTGSPLGSWGTYGSGNSQFYNPGGIAVDANSNVYVADSDNDRVQKFTSTGTYLTQWGGGFSNPQDIAIGAQGAVYVGDDSDRIQRFGEVTGDVTPPTANLATPPDQATYFPNQVVNASYTCTDEAGGSGIDTCQGTVANGAAIDTSTLGEHDFTVTAADNAGNATPVTHNYTVTPPRPDGRIKKGAGTFVGDNVYNATGLNQTRSGSAALGATVAYTIRVQNDALAPDRFRLNGTAATTRYGITYTVGSVDVTAAVLNGTYLTPELPPGDTITLRVVVKVKRTAPAGSSLTATLTAKSNSDSTARDTVKFVTRRS